MQFEVLCVRSTSESNLFNLTENTAHKYTICVIVQVVLQAHKKDCRYSTSSDLIAKSLLLLSSPAEHISLIQKHHTRLKLNDIAVCRPVVRKLFSRNNWYNLIILITVNE